jgi:hypothetical protein
LNFRFLLNTEEALSNIFQDCDVKQTSQVPIATLFAQRLVIHRAHGAE